MLATMSLSRRRLLVGAVASVIAPSAFADTGDVAFVVIGDWGEQTRFQQPVADAMGRVAAWINSAFVISTGDNFYPSGVSSIHDPQWRSTFEDIYSATALQTPWFVVLGNHDHMGSASAQVNYTRISSRWNMPAHYWRQEMVIADGSSAAFFFVDTTPITQLVGLRDRIPEADFGARDQLMWLERELATSAATWKIVVGHHPIYSSGVHGGSPGVFEHVRPLLERYGVQAYFNGHDHNLEHLESAGVNYICSGSGSEVRPVRSVPQSQFVLAQPGFVACTLSLDALNISFLGEDAARYYQATVLRS